MAKAANQEHKEEKEEKGVATLERALSILSTFEASTALPLAEISRRTGLYKSTLLRVLATLEKFGYIGQQADGKYHIGVAALHLGGLYQSWVKPADLINPVLQSLVKQTGESASFNVREGNVRVCVYRVDSLHKIRDHVRIGDTLPLGKGAVGKMLLAFGSERKNRRWASVRNACFCFTKGEIDPDTAAVAAPVFGPNNSLEGALAITGPASRYSEKQVQTMRLPLLRAALSLSRNLGGQTTLLDSAAYKAASSPGNTV